MNDEQINVAGSCCDEAKEDTLRSMFCDFYNRKMLFFVVIFWVYGLVFMALAIFSAIKFFRTDDTQYQIMYAAIFLGSIHIIGLAKILSWQMIHRNGIKREIKSLKACLAKLSQTTS